MPTYEYECDACQHRFDELQSITEAPLKKCPQCKKPKLRRLFGIGAGLIFKGSGFYQTDYRSESYKAAAAAEQNSAKAASDTSGTTDTAASAKSDSNGTPAQSADIPAKSSK